MNVRPSDLHYPTKLLRVISLCILISAVQESSYYLHAPSRVTLHTNGLCPLSKEREGEMLTMVLLQNNRYR